MKVLVISYLPTHPAISGNRFCTLSYAKLLIALGYDVSYFWIAEPNPPAEEVRLMKEFWGENFFLYKRNKIQRLIGKFYRSWRLRLMGNNHIDDYFPWGLVSVLRHLQSVKGFDCVIANYIFFSKSFFAFNNNVHKILYTHDVFTDRYKRTGNFWYSATKSQESKALNRADTVWAIQENEARYFNSISNVNVITTFTYFPVQETLFKGNGFLLYLASSNPANIEAITYFVNDIFYKLLIDYPSLKLIIGGGICSYVRHFKSENIDIFGDVKNVEDFYSLGDIVINPTFTGTGLKIKTFEAMSFGKVVICHPHNIEGIYDIESAPVLTAETYGEYKGHLENLFTKENEVKNYKMKSIIYMNQFNLIVTQRVKNSIEEKMR